MAHCEELLRIQSRPLMSVQVMVAVEMAGGHAPVSFRPCSLSENFHQSDEMNDQVGMELNSFRTSCMACRIEG